MQVSWKQLRQEIKDRHPTGYLLGVSGGVDSMFLLDFMHCSDVPFTVAHFNHGLRVNADQDQLVVTEYCTSRGIPYVLGYADAEQLRAASSIEAAARKARYEWLSLQMDAHGHARIMTGHHLDDQAETIMLHLFREHRLANFGMDVDNGLVYRPLLDIPKSIIVRQATRRNLTWRHDESNDDIAYERNWYRHMVLPMLAERRNPLALARVVNADKRKRNTQCVKEAAITCNRISDVVFTSTEENRG